MKLEYPLNDSLPNIQHARDRLLARIFHFRHASEHSSLATDGDYALLYAYGKSLLSVCLSVFQLDTNTSAVLVTGQLGSEIIELIGEISKLFGVLIDDVIELQ